MNREFLKGLGLADADIDKVMAEHGKTVEAQKTKATDLQTSVDDLTKQLGERDKQLTDLSKKAKGNEDLENQIKALQDENEKTTKDLNAKIQQQTFDYALERALSDAKAKNPKAVKALLNTEAIKLDGEKLLGLEEQLKSLTESDGYLFAEKQEEKPPAFKGFTPPDGKKGDGKEKDKSEDFGKSLAQFATGNADLEKARDSYFG